MKNQNDFCLSLKASLFENNGDLEDICEDLHYHGYHRAINTIGRFSTDIHNYRVFLEKDWKKTNTTNMMGRVKTEIKRRSRVVSAFPSDASLNRLIGSI
ncbi:MAG: hypothetical protein GXY48_15495 [Methanomicrobiales archaeon]|nr:hypothetical protein [Methanomicrobiales archaeon]